MSMPTGEVSLVPATDPVPTSPSSSVGDSRRTTYRAWLVVAPLVVLILCSSSSLAGHLADDFFRISYQFLFGPPGAQSQLVYHASYFVSEKSFHLILFLSLGLFLARPVRLGYAALLGVAVAAASESLQNFFPDRDPTIRDFLINVAGLALGFLIYTRFSLGPTRRLKKRESNNRTQPARKPSP